MKTYKVTYDPGAQRGLGTLRPAQRNAVLKAEKTLTGDPEAGAVFQGHGPNALRRMVLTRAGVSIGYRVYENEIQMEIVWLIGHP